MSENEAAGSGEGAAEHRPDPSAEEPQVFALRRRGSTWETTRRGFLAAAGATSLSAAAPATGAEPPPPAAESAGTAGSLTPLGPPVAAQFAHHQAIVGLAVDADGTTLVSASPDGTIKLWSLSDGSLLQTHTGWTGELLRYGEARQALLADKERQVLISTAGEFADKVALRSVPEAAILVRLSGFAGEVTSLAAAPGGQFIAVGTAHGKIHLFARDGQLVRTLSNAAGPITAVAVTGDGKCIVAYSGSQTIHRWLDGQLAGPVAKDKTTPAVLGVTPNGDGVCWAGPEEKDPVIRLWSAKEDRQVREFKEHKQRITTLLVTADGRQLLSGDTEGRLLVWDVDRKSVV